jgi:hypothetical protein
MFCRRIDYAEVGRRCRAAQNIAIWADRQVCPTAAGNFDVTIMRKGNIWADQQVCPTVDEDFNVTIMNNGNESVV